MQLSLERLSPQQLEIVRILHAAKGRWLTLGTIVYQLYSTKSGEEPEAAEDNLRVQVHNIRRRGKVPVENKFGHGYRIAFEHHESLAHALEQETAQ